MSQDDAEEAAQNGQGGPDAAAASRADAANGDKTVPQVDIALQGLSVSVSGRSEDDLDDVEQSARGLLDYLVEKTEELEDDRSEYGLS